jgi:hypothetical protein
MNVPRSHDQRPNFSEAAIDSSSTSIMARNHPARNERAVDSSRSVISPSTTSSSLRQPLPIMMATAMAPSSLPRQFRLQPFALNSAVSPLLRKPTAPFDRTERKRAHTSARYYSECVLKGIEPVVADSAAEDAQGKYDKWWVKAAASHPEKSETGMTKELESHTEKRCTFRAHAEQTLDRQNDEHVGKWRRIDTCNSHQQDDASFTTRAAVVSLASSAGGSRRDPEDEESPDDVEPAPVSIRNISTIAPTTPAQLNALKSSLIEDLRASGGSVHTPRFLECLEYLEAYYRSKSWDGRGWKQHGALNNAEYSGTWLTLSKPTYNECRGRNEKGEYLYTLGRLSFDMFKPTNLECSIQAVFNTVRPIDSKKPDRPLHGPKKLMKEISKGKVQLQTYE